MIPAGPLFQEHMRDFFTERSSLRWYRAYAVVLTVAVIVSWPSNPVSYYLQFSSTPITFPLTFMLMFLFSYILSLRPAVPHGENRNTMIDWVHYTPVGIITVVNGYLLYSIVHVLFLLLLAAPLLVTAAVASGIDANSSIPACLIVFVFCLFSKQLLQMLRLLFEKRPFLRILFFAGFVAFSILLSVRLYPSANPILAAQSAIDRAELLVPAWRNTVILYTVGIAATYLVSILRLALLRKEKRVSE